jgi:hypothetical protein
VWIGLIYFNIFETSSVQIIGIARLGEEISMISNLFSSVKVIFVDYVADKVIYQRCSRFANRSQITGTMTEMAVNAVKANDAHPIVLRIVFLSILCLLLCYVYYE